jgi:excisionase family DNA binding protein
MGDEQTGPEEGRPAFDLGLLRDLQVAVSEMANEFRSDGTLDLLFLAYLRRMSRFGYFHYGPVTIDVRVIEDLVERTVERGRSPGPGLHEYSDDYVRFTRVLMGEVSRTGQRRLDELHFLLAFMRCGEGLPARVFGELGVTPDQVELLGKAGPREQPVLEKLYSPEEVAAYLGVHVQTVRTWIREGRLPARRLAGQRALRVRESDLERVLEPLEWDGGAAPQ